MLFLPGGRNLSVGPCVYVRIDAEYRHRARPPLGGQLSEHDALLLVLDIELAYSGVERRENLTVCFADSGKDDSFWRHACGEGLKQFAPRHDVGTIAFLGQYLEHRKVRICLHGEGNMLVRYWC